MDPREKLMTALIPRLPKGTFAANVKGFPDLLEPAPSNLMSVNA